MRKKIQDPVHVIHSSTLSFLPQQAGKPETCNLFNGRQTSGTTDVAPIWFRKPIFF